MFRSCCAEEFIDPQGDHLSALGKESFIALHARQPVVGKYALRLKWGNSGFCSQHEEIAIDNSSLLRIVASERCEELSILSKIHSSVLSCY